MRHPTRAADGRECLVVSAVAFAAEALLPLRTGVLGTAHPDFPNAWDHQKYIQMASRAPLDFHIAPFCWRVGGPWLARLLPLPLETSFLLISYVSLALTGVFVYYLARARGFSRPSAAAGMAIFFSLPWAAKFALWDFWLPDALSFLLITVAIYATVTGRDALFAAAVTAGVAVKESAAFAIPLFYSLRAHSLVDRRVARRLLLLALPAALLLISLRAGIAQRNADPAYRQDLAEGVLNPYDVAPYDLVRLLGEIGRSRTGPLLGDTLERLTFGAFGAMVLLLPCFAVARNGPLLVRWSPFLALMGAQVLFANNVERLVVAAFPAVILLALNGLEGLAGALRLRTLALLPLPVLFFGLSVLHAPIGQPPLAIQCLVLAGYLALLPALRRARWAGAGA